ncbi:MAG: hypothetical protein P4L45_13220 [Ignavibacteriaceae bacterium]|nr:hypothetical protein [Ignavibacteriaceae bacterium]
MRAKYFFLIFIILISFTICKTPAQSAGLNFTLGFPMNEFRDNVKRTGFGGSFQFLFWNPTKEYPYSFGFDLGYLNYGSELRSEPFSSTIPDVTVDVNRTNNIVNFHLMAQIIPPTGRIKPYIELLLGGSYLYTETTINSWGSDQVASSNNFDDWAWSYGGGGGILFEIVPEKKFDKRLGSIYLDLKARYLYGTEAQYLKEGSVIVQRDGVTYEVSKSKTDLLTISLGVVAYFGDIFNGE